MSGQIQGDLLLKYSVQKGQYTSFNFVYLNTIVPYKPEVAIEEVD